MLEIKGLRTHFFTDRGVVKAVDGVDLVIGSGEAVGLVGESGCGKSITARSILRLIPPPGRIVSGEICFEGQDLLSLGNAEMRRLRGGAIAMIFQDPLTTLNPVLRVGPQIAEAVQIHGRVPLGREEDEETPRHPYTLFKSFARERALEMMELVHIPSPSERYGQFPHEFSGGMRQRVIIATALACNPRLLIADEPTTALDVTVQGQILRLMEEIKEKADTSLLLITHDLGVVNAFCDRVAVMYTGRIVEMGPTREVFQQPLHPYTAGLLQCLPSLRRPQAIQPIPGEVPDLLNLPPGCLFQDRCPRVMEACRGSEPELRATSRDRQVRCYLYEPEAPADG